MRNELEVVNRNELVTIGITSYNACDTIQRAIKSAQRQSWPHLEIVIVDDLSTDNSVDKILDEINGDARCRLLLHKKNLGPASARNSILNAASGVFVAFFDDDDESLPDRIEKQVLCILEYEAKIETTLIACYASGTRQYENGYVMNLDAIGSRLKAVPKGEDIAEYLLFFEKNINLFYGSGTPTCSLMARKSTFLEVEGFDPNLRRVEDADLAIRLGFSGAHFIGTKDRLFIQHSTGSPDKNPESNLSAELRMVEKHRDFLEHKNIYYYSLHWPKLRYFYFKRHYFLFTVELLGLFLRYPLRTCKHFISTAPKRLKHENFIKI